MHGSHQLNIMENSRKVRGRTIESRVTVHTVLINLILWRIRLVGRGRTIGNRVTGNTVPEFESLILRQKLKALCELTKSVSTRLFLIFAMAFLCLQKMHKYTTKVVKKLSKTIQRVYKDY